MFSTGPESKGIETAVGNETDRQFDGFSTGPESKGIETGRIPLPSPRESRFSTGPESKGIETVSPDEVFLSRPFSTGPESKGIETASDPDSDRLHRGSALALKAKGLRLSIFEPLAPASSVQHWP